MYPVGSNGALKGVLLQAAVVSLVAAGALPLAKGARERHERRRRGDKAKGLEELASRDRSAIELVEQASGVVHRKLLRDFG